jgi:hypothetical protein
MQGVSLSKVILNSFRFEISSFSCLHGCLYSSLNNDKIDASRVALQIVASLTTVICL